MATARSTSRWRGQKINTCCISTLQGNSSHWIRRKTVTPEATFCFFSFQLFTVNVTRALSLEAIKEEVRGHNRGGHTAID
jgi:hypothetical protein